MTTSSTYSSIVRWLLAIKYPILAALIAGAVWYVRSQPTNVSSHTITKGSVIRTVMGTGTLEARIRTTISPKIPGRIAEVFADQGSVVKAGEILVRLDDEDFKQQVRMANGVISTSEATFGKFRAEIEQAKSIFAKTEADLGRTQKLRATNSVSQSELDQTQEAFELAKSGLLKAEANLLEAEQQVALNRETLKFQEARLADTKLIAPFDGLIIKRERDVGAIVVPGTPILQLISLDEIWVSAWVDETEMDQLKAEQPAKIVFRSLPSTDFAGVVARLGKQADRETREFTVDIRALKLPETWAIGQRAEVFIETARIDGCLSIPSSFLTKQGGEQGTFVLVNSIATWRPLKTGIVGSADTEVIEGLSAGDVVVKPLEPAAKLSNGRKVIIR